MADRKILLADDQITEWLTGLPGWERNEQSLHRELTFGNFVEAFGFMSMVALVAEKMDHHPDWSNSWNTVTLDVTNHGAGGLTEIDFELASAIDRTLGER